ncbi:MAG: hypothetical protein LBD45_04860 [Bacteroidales bacterium]|jgi:hypothetical protein|nr:hypothetical protein [Bacteroidales bacterium]
MENIGDWIYLIFIAIAVIGSFFKPKKRAEQTPPVRNPHSHPEASERPVQSWDDVLHRFGERVTPKPEAEPVKKPKAKSFIETVSAENSQQRKTPLTSSIADRIKSYSNEQPVDTDSALVFNFNDLDEIKKGIVYSEIFRPIV